MTTVKNRVMMVLPGHRQVYKDALRRSVTESPKAPGSPQGQSPSAFSFEPGTGRTARVASVSTGIPQQPSVRLLASVSIPVSFSVYASVPVSFSVSFSVSASVAVPVAKFSSILSSFGLFLPSRTQSDRSATPCTLMQHQREAVDPLSRHHPL